MRMPLSKHNRLKSGLLQSASALLLSVSLAANGSLRASEPAEDPNAALERALEAAEATGSGTPAPTVPPGAAATPPAPAGPGDALDRALEAAEKKESPAPAAEPGARTSDVASARLGGVNLRLIDISLDALFAAGTSTATDEELQGLEGGGHDPRKRGFTVQNVELSAMGAVDPYFSAEAHLVYFVDPISGDSKFELEEAFLTTQALPWGFQVEAGQFQTEFGRLNPQHPHQWDWLDQPVVNTRFFGPDGMRGAGFRVGWLSPLPWFSEVHAGMQNANGETMASFLASEEFFDERPIGGRPWVARDVKTFEDLAYLVRWDNGFDITDELSGKAGASLAYGPNATGPEGFTRIYGGDLVFKWRPLDNRRGWPFVIWQTEAMRRDYRADSFFDEGDPADPADDVVLEADTLEDWGLYTQVLWGFRDRWAAGIRYEYAGVVGARDAESRDDPFRDTRHRVSPLLVWQLTEFSRLRLQYNFDHAEHLSPHGAHSVWLGVEVMLGAHAAHSY